MGFSPPFLLSFDSEGKPSALQFPAGWAGAVPGGMQPPAAFLARNFSPSRLPTSPATLAGARAKFSWTPVVLLEKK